MRVSTERVVGAVAVLLLALPAQAGGPDYDAFCDREGRITTKEHGLGLFKLVSSAAELESVFEEAKKGNPRAKRVFEELETSYFPDTGRELAELVSRPPCLVPALRELSGWCVPDWSFLDFLSKDKPGGVRLRVALLNGYLERARQRNLENRLVLSAMTSILGVAVVASALQEAGVAARATQVAEAPRPRGLGNIGGHEIPIDPTSALRSGLKWLGPGYKEISPGVYRSADGLRQFRMTNADLTPTHGNIGSHVHFEALDETGTVVENLHLPVGK